MTQIDIDGQYTVSDHGLEYFTETPIAVYAIVIYGNNLKNKLERDVLTKSTDLVNNLTTDDATKALSAAQGKALNSKIGKYDCSDSSVDVDTLGTGFVYAGSSSANLPEASACFVLTFRNDSSKATQIALKRSGVGMWIRQCSSGNWGNWEKVTTS